MAVYLPWQPQTQAEIVSFVVDGIRTDFFLDDLVNREVGRLRAAGVTNRTKPSLQTKSSRVIRQIILMYEQNGDLAPGTAKNSKVVSAVARELIGKK